MEYIFDSLKKAFVLIGTLDNELLRISWTSIWITGTSVTLATLFSLPAAVIIATKRFKGKGALVTTLNTLMALPTVVVGLLVYAFLYRRGLLGNFSLLYTPYAMIIGQVILASPIITALTVSALEGADERIEGTALTLGATKFQALMSLSGEVRPAITAAVIAGFGRIFAEVGVSMMLGGNIRNYTRNITTAIAFETARGQFSLALALGMILLLFAFTVNILLQWHLKSQSYYGTK
ncbi:MAG: ABC transporter permease subunit [Nitrospirae bacterium]|nr:ABC transporter permease subunit [Nitrospirota bacterium]